MDIYYNGEIDDEILIGVIDRALEQYGIKLNKTITKEIVSKIEELFCEF